MDLNKIVHEVRPGQTPIQAMYEITAQWRLEESAESQILAAMCDAILLASRGKQEDDRVAIKVRSPEPEFFRAACMEMPRHVLKTQNGHHYTIFPISGEFYSEDGDIEEIWFIIPYWITRNSEERPALDLTRLKKFTRVRERAQDFLDEATNQTEASGGYYETSKQNTQEFMALHNWTIERRQAAEAHEQKLVAELEALELLSQSPHGKKPEGLTPPVEIEGPPSEEYLREHRGPDPEDQ